MTNSGKEAYQSLKLFVDNCIVPELITGRLKKKVEEQSFVKELLNSVLIDVCKS